MILLDTNILIEIVRKNVIIIQKCDIAGTEHLAISSITKSEFLVGSSNREDFIKK